MADPIPNIPAPGQTITNGTWTPPQTNQTGADLRARLGLGVSRPAPPPKPQGFAQGTPFVAPPPAPGQTVSNGTWTPDWMVPAPPPSPMPATTSGPPVFGKRKTVPGFAGGGFPNGAPGDNSGQVDVLQRMRDAGMPVPLPAPPAQTTFAMQSAGMPVPPAPPAPSAPSTPAQLSSPAFAFFAHDNTGPVDPRANMAGRGLPALQSGPSPQASMWDGLFGNNATAAQLGAQKTAAGVYAHPTAEALLNQQPAMMAAAQADPVGFSMKLGPLLDVVSRHQANNAVHNTPNGPISVPMDDPANVHAKAGVLGVPPAAAHLHMEPHKYSDADAIAAISAMPLGVTMKLLQAQHFLTPQQTMGPQYLQYAKSMKDDALKQYNNMINAAPADRDLAQKNMDEWENNYNQAFHAMAVGPNYGPNMTLGNYFGNNGTTP